MYKASSLETVGKQKFSLTPAYNKTKGTYKIISPYYTIRLRSPRRRLRYDS
jgi:hypothetical protein